MSRQRGYGSCGAWLAAWVIVAIAHAAPSAPGLPPADGPLLAEFEHLGEATGGDPILDNPAVRAYLNHLRPFKQAADRAQAARREYESHLHRLETARIAPTGRLIADEAMRFAERGAEHLKAAIARTRASDADPLADYRAAADDFARAAKLLEGILPKPPADPITRIARDGEFFLPSGADLLAAGTALRDRKVRLFAVIADMSEPFDPNGHTLLVTDDGRFRIQVRWEDCPDALRQQFDRRSTGPRAMRKGVRLWLEGTISGFDGKDGCILKPTHYRQAEAQQ